MNAVIRKGMNGLARRCFAAATAALLTAGAFSAVAQEAPVLLTGQVRSTVGKELKIFVGHSAALRTTWKIKRVSVANPDVADVDALETNEVLVVAKKLGKTDLIIWGEDGQVWHTTVDVDINLNELNGELADIFPGSTVHMVRSRDVFFAKGVLSTADQARQLREYLHNAEIKYVDQTSVAGLQQVMIKVRVAEVNRVAVKRMGVNILKAGEDFFGTSAPGPASGGAANQIPIGPAAGGLASQNDIPFFFGEGVISPFNTLVLGFPGADLEFFIDALAQNQYLKILAEPTLVSLSGQEANFLAGGEFPIPVVQGTATGGGPSISIEYKEFGIRLQFTPTVLGNGRIRLEVAPEVSELSDIGSVELQGFRVPSVMTRRAHTVLEMNSGQTFSMAGLLSQTVNARNSRTPFLGDLPVLGSLFRSVSYQKGESELVVLVTPTLVEPNDHAVARPVPGDLHQSPNDWELFGLGKLEGGIESLDGVSDDSVELGKLEDLKGPGAWASYYNDEPVDYEKAEPTEKVNVDVSDVSGD